MKTNTVTVIFLLFFLFSTTINLAQTTKIDSLITELQEHKKLDTIRVNLLNDLAYAYRKGEDIDKAMTYLEESEAISEAVNFTKGRAKSLYIKGVLEAVESNYRRGFQNYTESIELYKTISWKEGIAECYKDMGVFMYHDGDQRKAIEYYKKSMEILYEYGKKKEISLILYEIGWSYIEIDNYAEARSHLLKALNLSLIHI